MFKIFSIPGIHSYGRKWLVMEYHLFNPLNAELNPICHFLALLGGATTVVVSRLRINGRFMLTFKSSDTEGNLLPVVNSIYCLSRFSVHCSSLSDSMCYKHKINNREFLIYKVPNHLSNINY